ncbi:hypothetical protein JYQ62_36695 [Nostoc sp. UHCC 0702]|nr:hypothetical protein JYQ62_36695 [Nostoc sp. UHCC 0702]
MQPQGFNEESCQNDRHFGEVKLKRGTLVTESSSAFFLESEQVAILNGIKDNVFSNSRFFESYLSDLQIFLESCFLSNCFNARLEEFLAELSIFLKKDLSIVKHNFKSSWQFFIDLADLALQIESQFGQVIAIADSIPCDDDNIVRFDNLNAEVFVAHYTCAIESLTEFRTYLSDYISKYWLYSPVEIQEFITNYTGNLDNIKDIAFEDFLSSDVLEQYESANYHLKFCVSEVSQYQQGIPKFTISDLKLSSETEISSQIVNSSFVCSPLFDTSYTLKDLLDQVLEETRHDGVSRGEFVGRELW